MSAALLDIEGVSKSFGKLAAIRDVSFAIRPGEIRGLIGPNGSGKTTMFNLISGFLKPTGGDIRLEGCGIAGLRPHRIARAGLVRTFQLTSLYRDSSAIENVMLGHHLRRRALGGTAAVRDSALEILAFLGLASVADSPARLLPAGTQRTLSIATALAAAPRLLLLDEPLAGLHPSEKASVVEKIRRLPERGVTVLLVEHDVRSVLSVCDRIVVINFGQRIFDGTPAAVTADPGVAEAYLGKAHDA